MGFCLPHDPEEGTLTTDVRCAALCRAHVHAESVSDCATRVGGLTLVRLMYEVPVPYNSHKPLLFQSQGAKGGQWFSGPSTAHASG